MRAVMAFVLGPCSGDEVVECLHLGGHVFHLGVDYTDGLIVHRLRGGLDRGVLFVDGLPVVLHFAFQRISGLEDLLNEQNLLLRPNVHAITVMLVCRVQG